MVHAPNKEEYSSTNRIAIAERSSPEEVDRPSPYPGGGGVLPYVALTGTCGPIGYGFQGVLSSTGYLFHHFLS